jgi:hypothetical protein
VVVVVVVVVHLPAGSGCADEVPHKTERWGSVLGNNMRGELYFGGGETHGVGGGGGGGVVVVVGGARAKGRGDLGPSSKTGRRGSVLTNDVRGSLQIDRGCPHCAGYDVIEVVVVVSGARVKKRGDLGPPRKTDRF